jgi:hypothetical protein
MRNVCFKIPLRNLETHISHVGEAVGNGATPARSPSPGVDHFQKQGVLKPYRRDDERYTTISRTTSEFSVLFP